MKKLDNCAKTMENCVSHDINLKRGLPKGLPPVFLFYVFINKTALS